MSTNKARESINSGTNEAREAINSGANKTREYFNNNIQWQDANELDFTNSQAWEDRKGEISYKGLGDKKERN